MRGQNSFPGLAVAVWIMAGSVVTEANASGATGGGNLGSLLKGLNLTPEQKHGTEDIEQGDPGDLITGKMEVLQARQNLLAVMNGICLDENDLHTAYRVLTATEENLTVLRAKLLQEATPVLTLDQQTAVKNKVEKMSLRLQRSTVKLQSKLKSPLLSDRQVNEGPGGS